MKKFALAFSLALCALPLLASLAVAGGPMKSESGWFDFENCAFCKNLTAEDGLLEHSTWENHPIKNGVMNIVTVEPEYAAAMVRAGEHMNTLGMKIQSGEVNPMGLKMCQHCQTFGMTMMSGKMNMEEVRGGAAVVTLMTSDDAAVVTKLHEMAARDTKEMALMMGGGSDHPHGKSEHPKGNEHPTGNEHPHK